MIIKQTDKKFAYNPWHLSLKHFQKAKNSQNNSHFTTEETRMTIFMTLTLLQVTPLILNAGDIISDPILPMNLENIHLHLNILS